MFTFHPIAIILLYVILRACRLCYVLVLQSYYIMLGAGSLLYGSAPKKYNFADWLIAKRTVSDVLPTSDMLDCCLGAVRL